MASYQVLNLNFLKSIRIVDNIFMVPLSPITQTGHFSEVTISQLKNKCPVCKKIFCCSAHRADHELKNHSETYPKLKEDFLVKLFRKRGENILPNLQNLDATYKLSDITKTNDTYTSQKHYEKLSFKNPRKRVYKEISKQILSKSVNLSETRKILIPVHRIPEDVKLAVTKNNRHSHKVKLFEGSLKTPPFDGNLVKTSTPIIEGLSKEKTTASSWDYISPASSISYYGTPQMAVDLKSEGMPLTKPPSNKTLVTPLRSIMAKNSKYLLDSEMGPSPNFNSSKGRRVTFSFSSSRISSTNSSPLESVQEIEIHEQIQEKNREGITSVSSVKNLSRRRVSAGVMDEKYVLEVTSTINSSVHSDLNDENKNMHGFNEDSLASMNGRTGLFSCVTNMFCTAVHTFPLWRGSYSGNRSKRSRSPNIESDKAVIVHSPLPKRPCYPSDLRLNPIRARKPISQNE